YLLSKLQALGFDGTLRNWIVDFLSGRSQQVVVNGAYSEACEVTSGVIQGCCIGPLLFVCYINNLPAYLGHPNNVYLFANDTKFFAPSHSPDIFLDCNLRMFSWFEKWGLKLAKDKCVLLHVGPNPPNYISAHDLAASVGVELVNVTRDLGVLVDDKLKFSHHCALIAKRRLPP